MLSLPFIGEEEGGSNAALLTATDLRTQHQDSKPSSSPLLVLAQQRLSGHRGELRREACSGIAAEAVWKHRAL